MRKVTSAAKVVAKDLAARLSDPAFQSEIEQAIRELPPDRAAELAVLATATAASARIGFAVNPSLYPNAGYDALVDFVRATAGNVIGRIISTQVTTIDAAIEAELRGLGGRTTEARPA